MKRSEALDALRGVAIILMILSGSIPFGGVLPAWMYHAQCPPPTHVFNPLLPGITWVDLVFPFFIFSMGAAIPLSVGARLAKGIDKGIISFQIVERAVLLIFFAYFIHYFHFWNINGSPINIAFPLICFAMFFVLFLDFKSISEKVKYILKGLSLLVLTILTYYMNLKGNISFSFSSFDIIIMVLANISLFGGLFYLFFNQKRHYIYILYAVILFLYSMCFILKVPDFVTIVKYPILKGIFSLNYLKYLLILIPAMFTGELLRDFSKSGFEIQKSDRLQYSCVALLGFISIIVIVCGLYNRYVLASFVVVQFIYIAIYLMQKKRTTQNLLVKLLLFSYIFTTIGYFVEPLQGGIKKDSATLSYLVMLVGMAQMMLLVFIIVFDILKRGKYLNFLSLSGKNPMVAYSMTGLVTLPLFSLLYINDLFNISTNIAFCGMMKAIIITSLAAFISGFLSKKKIFWRT